MRYITDIYIYICIQGEVLVKLSLPETINVFDKEEQTQVALCNHIKTVRRVTLVTHKVFVSCGHNPRLISSESYEFHAYLRLH